MTFAEIEKWALAGEKVTEADIQSAIQADIEAKLQRYTQHLNGLDNPDCEPCGNPLCSCNPAFRPRRKS